MLTEIYKWQLNKLIFRTITMIHTITGSNFTGFTSSAKGSASFQAFSPVANSFLEGDFHYATEEEMEHALQLAQTAFAGFQKISFIKRKFQ